jgi:hypothetical protein
MTVGGYGQTYLQRLQGAQRGAPTAALATGVTSDAPPIGMPTTPQVGADEENPPTPTDIKPMPTVLAQAGGAPAPAAGPAGAVPGPTTPAASTRPPSATQSPIAPTPAAPQVDSPAVVRAVNPAQGPKPVAPLKQEYLSPEELKGIAIQQQAPDNDIVQAWGQKFIDFGKARREAEYQRQVEQYKSDIQYWNAQELQRVEREANLPKTQLELQEQASKLRAAQAQEQSRTAFGTLPDHVVSYLSEGKKNALAAVGSLEGLRNAREAMNAGTVFGIDAQAKLLYYRARAAMGDPDAQRIVAATETFKTNLGPVAQAAIRAYGGTQISNQDRLFGLQMSGADIGQNEASAKRLLDIAERSAQAKIAEHRSDLDDILQGQPPRVKRMFDVPEPVASTPFPAKPSPQAAPVIDVGSEAEAQSLPQGTRFRLNGRTGTVR